MVHIPLPRSHGRHRPSLCQSLMRPERYTLRLSLHWLVLIVLLGASSLLCAQPADPWKPFLTPWFERISTVDGLPHSVTTAVVQDSRGLIWVGTMGGLARFDGYRMQVFESHVGAHDLPDAYVRTLLPLPDGGLLVGTNAGGLARFDPSTNSFHTYPIGKNGVADRKIYSLARDGARGVWIATDRGINHLDLATDTLTRIDTGTDAAPRNFTVFEDREGNLWLGNDRGLFERPRGQLDFIRPAAGDHAVAVVLQNQIWALHEDTEGRLWAGSGQAGVAYRGVHGQWHVVPGFNGHPDQSSLATVRAISDSGDGSIWIATDGAGVLDYTPGESRVRPMAHDAAVPSSLPGDSVRGLLKDDVGNLWAATDLGLARTNPAAQIACSMLPSPLNPDSLSDTNVHAILVDSRKRIWLGLGSGRIDLINLADGSMRHLRLEGPQSHRDVQAFAEMPDGTIWVGAQGLARIDPDTLAITDEAEPKLTPQPVLSLQEADGALLIGTYVGAFRYVPATGALVQFRHDANDPHSLASDTVREIAKVGSHIWYGTTAGISVANNATDTGGFHTISHHAGVAGTLPQDYIGSVATDPAGQTWVATFGGLGRLQARAPDQPYTFQVFGTEAGLESDKINTVLPDQDGHIWVSMSNGVAMVDPATGTASNLGARDGLHIPSYIYLAEARAPGGALLFGGLGGLTVIRHPDHIPAATPIAPPEVTSERINGKPLPFGQLARTGSTITLDRHSRSLQVGFALLDYRAALETSYSYRMEGFDDGWTEVPPGSPPSAVYTNLPHGDYRLHLRASTRGMHPTTVQNTLMVTVQPKWYETLWLRLAAALGLLLLVVLLSQLRTAYLRRQALRLQQQVDDRTRDLQEANARLDRLAGTDELTGVYNRRRFLEMTEGIRELAAEGTACLAVLDLDRFKQINDNHGHLAGDAVIRAVTDIIVGQCAAADIVGRYGGEELVICMPDCDATTGEQAAERVRDALAAAEVHFGGHAIRVTTSIGMAAIGDGESVMHWLARADAALYQAKGRGRNCVVMAPRP